MSIIFSLVSVLLVSIVSLVGLLTISLKENILRKYVFIFVSLAVGALLGDAFIHIIPEAVEEIGSFEVVSLLTIAGIFLFFLVEKFMHWHHHQDDSDVHTHKVGKMILISDGLHNFIDGIIIGASYLISVEVGIATTIAVLIHEIPQEIGDFGVLIHSGYSKVKALTLNFLSAIVSVFGVLTVYVLGEITEYWALFIMPIAAGGFIYIAIADLVPELLKEKKGVATIIQLLFASIGVISMIALLGLE